MYKTGDIVSYTYDGTVLFHGRKNSKVKVRGQWVEVSEVESIARQHFTGITTILVDHLESHSSLVSYLLWGDGSTASKNQNSAGELLVPPIAEFKGRSYIVRKAMLASVPDHMVPIFFACLLYPSRTNRQSRPTPSSRGGEKTDMERDLDVFVGC